MVFYKLNNYTESFQAKIGEVSRKISSQIDINKEWSNQKIWRNKFESRSVADDIFIKLKESYDGMKTSKTFHQYKKHFDTFCNLIGIPKEQMIITKVKLRKGENSPNKNYVYVKYAISNKQITIPNGSSLYHMSTTDSIRELKPTFRSREESGYFYSSERVYFTIRKSLSKYCADIKRKSKITYYQPVENIRSVQIDPLVPFYTQGAVFIETSNPIKVEKIKMEKESEDISPEDQGMITETEFSSLEEFMTFYGLEFAEDDEYMEESVKGFLGTQMRSKSFNSNWKKMWLSKIESAIHVKDKSITFNSEKELKDAMEQYITISETTSYSKYKKAFKKLLSYYGYNADRCIINRIFFNKETLKSKINVGEGKYKLIVPNGTILVHVSPQKGITELQPTFRSKTKGKYLYSSKRVFFTLKKDIAPNHAGLEKQKLYRYTPKENIQTVWVDQSYPDFKTGAVYVETDYPIAVKELE